MSVRDSALPFLSGNSVLRMNGAAGSKIASRQDRARARIVAHGSRLFLAYGFPNVSVDHIVGAAEIARSSFYRFFANREALLASIIRPVFESGTALMADVGGRPPRQIMDGVFGVYLHLWREGPEALQLATRMGGAYFRLFEDVHEAFRDALTDTVRRVEPTGLLLNGSGDHSARLIARTAVPVLEVYRDEPHIETVFRQTMNGLLLKPEAQS